MALAVEVEDVCVRFESEVETVIGLDRVSLSANAGEFVVLRGPSGSGKTTLLHAIGGLQSLDDGHVRVAGETVDATDEAKSAKMRLWHIGVVFQDHNLLPEFTALENVSLPLRAQGHGGDAGSLALEQLQRVGLGDRAQHRPAQLSGGQRQRVGIARALVGGRSVLLADEPTGSLDSATSTDIFTLLRELADNGITVIVASHDDRVVKYADRVIDLEDGRLVSPTPIGAE